MITLTQDCFRHFFRDFQLNSQQNSYRDSVEYFRNPFGIPIEISGGIFPRTYSWGLKQKILSGFHRVFSESFRDFHEHIEISDDGSVPLQERVTHGGEPTFFVYSQLSLRWTPLGPASAVCL